MTDNKIKPSRATISVEWGYENHSITLTAKNWAKIKAGKPHGQRGEGYSYESTFFWDHWSFGGGMDGDLKVSYKSTKEGWGDGFDGSLKDADIKEHI